MHPFPRAGWIFALCASSWLLPGLPALHAGRILVDFGVNTLEVKGPDAAGRFWNAASLPPSTPAAVGSFAPLELKDDKGAASGAVLKVVDPFLGAYDSGDNNQDLYPINVGKDRWSLEKGKKDQASLLVTGLNPSQTYDFHFFAVRDAPITFVTLFNVNGKTVTLAAQNNRANLGSVTGVVPNSDGTAKIDVSIAEGPNAHLSAMEITWGGEVPTRAGQFTAFYPKPVVRAPTPVASTSSSQSSAQAYKPAPKPTTPVAPAPVLSKSQMKVEKSKTPLIAGVLLLLIGLGLGGFSGYKLAGR
ncbi:MAG: hypothetical protein SFU85_03175 [Candidatus Methylacidiphilales bacterium]|nr:hypothetical protein [Candidatus Methylacidiphilales bacterium]